MQLQFFLHHKTPKPTGSKFHRGGIPRGGIGLLLGRERSPSVSTTPVASTCRTLFVNISQAWIEEMISFWKMRMAQSRVGYWCVDPLILSFRETPNSSSFDRSQVPRVSCQSVQSSATMIWFSIYASIDVFPDRSEELEKEAGPNHEE